MLLATLASVVAPVARAELPPDRLAFASVDPETRLSEIVSINVDGSDVRRLTAGSFDTQAAWSPDGKRLAFTRFSVTQATGGVWVVSSDGSGLREVAAFAEQPAWSPDGKRLAFARIAREGQDRSQDGIYIADAEGGEPRRLTDAGADPDRGPAWSPDGTVVAFFDVGGVFRVGADAGGVRQLIGADRAPIQRLEWSPDGTRLGYAGRFDEAGRGAIYIVDAQTGDPLRLTEPETANACRATWSPDGSRLAFDAGPDGCEGALGIWVVDADGSMPRQLTGLATHDLFPAWSPDATRIAFTRRTGADSLTPSDLYVVRSDGSRLAKVNDGGAARLFGFAPGPVLRVSGPSRVETALALSRQLHASADTIILASAEDYADALAGAPLAGGWRRRSYFPRATTCTQRSGRVSAVGRNHGVPAWR
jgi:Tol biopolymer transport system component